MENIEKEKRTPKNNSHHKRYALCIKILLFVDCKNKIKINWCLVSNQFIIVPTIPCATFHYLI